MDNNSWQLIIQAIQAIATVLAVVVALFKESIFRWWNKPKIIIEPSCEHFLEENTSSYSSDKEILKADEYKTNLVIKNNGKSEVKNICVYIKRLMYMDVINKKQEKIKINEENKLIYHKDSLPVTMDVDFDMIKIKQNNSSNESDGKNKSNKVNLIVGKQEIPEKFHNGEIKIEYFVLCDGYKKDFIVNIKWNGSWQNRLSEMRQILDITGGK